jgi:hypothetical protein
MATSGSWIDAAPVRRRRARILRYLVALLLGLGVAAVFGYEALLSTLFDSCGKRCPAEHARVVRLWRCAVAAPFVSVGACAVAELVAARVRAQRASGAGPGPVSGRE